MGVTLRSSASKIRVLLAGTPFAPSARLGGTTMRRRPDFFIPSIPSSQPWSCIQTKGGGKKVLKFETWTEIFSKIDCEIDCETKIKDKINEFIRILT